jgi:hypothetical protein
MTYMMQKTDLQTNQPSSALADSMPSKLYQVTDLPALEKETLLFIAKESDKTQRQLDTVSRQSRAEPDNPLLKVCLWTMLCLGALSPNSNPTFLLPPLYIFYDSPFERIPKEMTTTPPYPPLATTSPYSPPASGSGSQRQLEARLQAALDRYELANRVLRVSGHLHSTKLDFINAVARCETVLIRAETIVQLLLDEAQSLVIKGKMVEVWITDETASYEVKRIEKITQNKTYAHSESNLMAAFVCCRA